MLDAEHQIDITERSTELLERISYTARFDLTMLLTDMKKDNNALPNRTARGH